MDHPDLSNPQKPSARRRLIRGALAAPALMTVLSGSAFAVASTSCVANAQNLSPQPAAGSSAPDTYLRAQLYKVTNGGVDTFYIRGRDLGTFQRSSDIPNDGFYLRIDPETFETSGAAVATPTGVETEVQKFAAMRFDATGRIVGIGKVSSSGGALMSMGCWQSAFPGA